MNTALKTGLAGFIAFAALSAALSATSDASETSPLYGSGACTGSEHWTFTGAVFESKRDDFKASLKGSLAPVRGFSEALALRRFAPNNETRFLGEYWISRALFDGKLPHIAFNGFASIAQRPVKPETAGVQLSALDCMLLIQSNYPSIPLPAGVTANILAFRKQAVTPEMRDVVWRAASAALQVQLALKPVSSRKVVADEKVDSLMDVLKDAGTYEDFAIAIRATHTNDHNTAVTRFDRFLNAASMPAALKRHVNTAQILMARSLYSLKQFDRAGIHLKLVTKSSNELAGALEGLAWSLLMNDNLTQSIGTAMNLQAGGLRHTFAPEAPMVMAMALNELCQYPESVRAIRSFQRNYEKAYKWLGANVNDNLYPKAVQFIRRAPGQEVPDRIASEWVRSPMFISSQDELNLLFEEQESTIALGRSGAREQTKIADSLLLRAKPLPSRLKAAKAKMKEGDSLPLLLREDLLALKDMILRYRRLQQGAPVWHTILANHKKSAKTTELKLVAAINADLRTRSLRMLTQLEEISENIQLIEVEIYNGASQDIIWQNAHPEFKKIAQKMKEEQRREATAKSMDWGRAPASLDDEGGEVWEDELGSFAANLNDNCSSKDKYLAIRAGR